MNTDAMNRLAKALEDQHTDSTVQLAVQLTRAGRAQRQKNKPIAVQDAMHQLGIKSEKTYRKHCQKLKLDPAAVTASDIPALKEARTKALRRPKLARLNRRKENSKKIY